eukprot:PhF_6_TR1991/c0_g1_i1/m.3342
MGNEGSREMGDLQEALRRAVESSETRDNSTDRQDIDDTTSRNANVLGVVVSNIGQRKYEGQCPFSDNVHTLPSESVNTLENIFQLPVEQLYQEVWGLLSREDKLKLRGVDTLWVPPPTPTVSSMTKGSAEDVVRYVQETFARITNKGMKLSEWDLRCVLLSAYMASKQVTESGGDLANQEMDTRTSSNSSKEDYTTSYGNDALPDVTTLLVLAIKSQFFDIVENFLDSIDVVQWIQNPAVPKGLTATFNEMLKSLDDPKQTVTPSFLRCLIKMCVICGRAEDVVRLVLYSTQANKDMKISDIKGYLQTLHKSTQRINHISPQDSFCPLGECSVLPKVIDAYAVTKDETVVVIGAGVLYLISKPWNAIQKQITLSNVASITSVFLGDSEEVCLWSASAQEVCVVNTESSSQTKHNVPVGSIPTGYASGAVKTVNPKAQAFLSHPYALKFTKAATVEPFLVKQSPALQGLSFVLWVRPRSIISNDVVFSLHSETTSILTFTLQPMASGIEIRVGGVPVQIHIQPTSDWISIAATLSNTGDWTVCMNNEHISGKFSGVPWPPTMALHKVELFPTGSVTGVYGGFALWNTQKSKDYLNHFVTSRRTTDAVCFFPMEERSGHYLCEVVTKQCVSFTPNSGTRIQKLLPVRQETSEVVACGITVDSAQSLLISGQSVQLSTATYAVEMNLDGLVLGFPEISHTSTKLYANGETNLLYRIENGRLLKAENVTEIIHAKPSSSEGDDEMTLFEAMELLCESLFEVSFTTEYFKFASRMNKLPTSPKIITALLDLFKNTSNCVVLQWLLNVVSGQQLNSYDAEQRKNFFQFLNNLHNHENKSIARRSKLASLKSTQETIDILTLEEIALNLPQFPDVSTVLVKLLSKKPTVVCDLFKLLSATMSSNVRILHKLLVAFFALQSQYREILNECIIVVLQQCAKSEMAYSDILLPAMYYITLYASNMKTDQTEQVISLLQNIVKATSTFTKDQSGFEVQENMIIMSAEGKNDAKWIAITDLSYCTSAVLESTTTPTRLHIVRKLDKTETVDIKAGADSKSAGGVATVEGGCFVIESNGLLRVKASIKILDYKCPVEVHTAATATLTHMLQRMLANDHAPVPYQQLLKSCFIRGGQGSVVKDQSYTRARALLSHSEESAGIFSHILGNLQEKKLSSQLVEQLRSVFALCYRFCEGPSDEITTSLRVKLQWVLERSETRESLSGLAEWVLEHVNPPTDGAGISSPIAFNRASSGFLSSTPKQSKRRDPTEDGLQLLLSGRLPPTVEDLQNQLEYRRGLAQRRIVALRTISQSITEGGDLFSHLVILKNGIGTRHYLDDVAGCGLVLEAQIRNLYILIVTYALQKISKTIERVPVHRLLDEAVPNASTFGCILSLLSQPWEPLDIELLMRHNVIHMLRQLFCLESMTQERKSGFPRSSSLVFASPQDEEVHGAKYETLTSFTSVDLILKNTIYNISSTVASVVTCDRGYAVTLQASGGTRLEVPWSVRNDVHVLYFEVTFPENFTHGFVGLIDEGVKLDSLPCATKSCVIFETDGKVVFPTATHNFGVPVTGSMTVGLGVVTRSGDVFLTINGQYLGTLTTLPSNFNLYPTFGWRSTGVGTVNTGDSTFYFDRRTLHPIIRSELTQYTLQDLAMHLMYVLSARASLYANDNRIWPFILCVVEHIGSDLTRLIELDRADADGGSTLKANITHIICDHMISRLFATLSVLAIACIHVDSLQQVIFPPVQNILANSSAFDVRAAAVQLLHKVVSSSLSPQLSTAVSERLLMLMTSGTVAAPPSTYVPRWSPNHCEASRMKITNSRESSTFSVVKAGQCSIAADPPIPSTGVHSFSVKITRNRTSLGSQYYVGLCADEYRDWVDHNVKYRPHKIWALHDHFDNDKMEHASKHIDVFAKDSKVMYGSGDLLVFTVDMDRRCISIMRNKTSFGVVFSNIPPGVVLRPFARVYNLDAVGDIQAYPHPVSFIVNPENVIVNNVSLLLREWLGMPHATQALLQAATVHGKMAPLLQVLGLGNDHGTLMFRESSDCATRVSLQRVDKGTIYVRVEDTGEIRPAAIQALHPAPLLQPIINVTSPEQLNQCLNFLVSSVTYFANDVILKQKLLSSMMKDRDKICKEENVAFANIVALNKIEHSVLPASRNSQDGKTKFCVAPKTITLSTTYKSPEIQYIAIKQNQGLFAPTMLGTQEKLMSAYSSQPISSVGKTSFSVLFQRSPENKPEFEKVVYIGFVEVPLGETPLLIPSVRDIHPFVMHPKTYGIPNAMRREYDVSRFVGTRGQALYRPGDLIQLTVDNDAGTISMVVTKRGTQDVANFPNCYKFKTDGRLFFWVCFAERGLSMEIRTDPDVGANPVRATSVCDQYHLNLLEKKHSCDVCKSAVPAGSWYQCSVCPHAMDLCEKCFKNGCHVHHAFAAMHATTLCRPAKMDGIAPISGCHVYAMHQPINIVSTLELPTRHQVVLTDVILASSLNLFVVKNSKRIDVGIMEMKDAQHLLQDTWKPQSPEEILNHGTVFAVSNSTKCNKPRASNVSSHFNFKVDEDFLSGELIGVQYDSSTSEVLFHRDGAAIDPKFASVAPSIYVCYFVVDEGASVEVIGDPVLCAVEDVDMENRAAKIRCLSEKTMTRWQSFDGLSPALSLVVTKEIGKKYIWFDSLQNAYYPIVLNAVEGNKIEATIEGTDKVVLVSPNTVYTWKGKCLPRSYPSPPIEPITLPTGILCCALRTLLFFLDHPVVRMSVSQIVSSIGPLCAADQELMQLDYLDMMFSYDVVINMSSECLLADDDIHLNTFSSGDIGACATSPGSKQMLRVVDLDSGMFATDEGDIVECQPSSVLFHDMCNQCSNPMFTPLCANGESHLQKCEISDTSVETHPTQKNLLAALARHVMMGALPHIENIRREDIVCSLWKGTAQGQAKHILASIANKDSLTFEVLRSAVHMLNTSASSDQIMLAVFIIHELSKSKCIHFTTPAIYSDCFRGLVRAMLSYPKDHAHINKILECLLHFATFLTPHPCPEALHQIRPLLSAPNLSSSINTLILGEISLATSILSYTSHPVRIITTFCRVLQSTLSGTSWPALEDIDVSPPQKVDVVMCEGTMINPTTLQTGKVRASLAGKLGKVYYEVHLPERTQAVIGWGTASHETESRGKHVGSDRTSWGFRPADFIVMNGGEQTPIPRGSFPNTQAGDVIGSCFDFDNKQIVWTLNGAEICSFPVVTEIDVELYPYVSCASAAGTGCEIVLYRNMMKYVPENVLCLDGSTGSLDESLKPIVEASKVSARKPKTLEYYEQLVSFLDELEDNKLNLEDKPTQEKMSGFSLVNELFLASPEDLQKDIHVLNVFGFVAERFMEYVECQKTFGTIRQFLRLTHRLVKRTLRRNVLNKFFMKLATVSDRPPEIVIDFTNVNKDHPRSCDEALKCSVLGQVLRALNSTPKAFLQKPMFKVVGTAGMDLGGLYRNAFSAIGEEIMLQPEQCYPTSSKHWTGLFQQVSPAGGTVMPVISGPTLDLCCSREGQAIYRNLGKLMAGVLLNNDINIPADFPPMFWKFMAGDDITFEDYIASIDRNADTMVTQAVSLAGSHEELDELLPGIAVTFKDNQGKSDEYIIQQYLIHRYDAPLKLIREGMASVIPIHVLETIPWKDMCVLINGIPDVTYQFLLEETVFDGCPDNVKQWLLAVLKAFSNEERALYMKFCTGQKRPPLYHKMKVTYSAHLNGLPSARTCSYLLELRKVTSEAHLQEQLLTAIRGCQDFGFL